MRDYQVRHPQTAYVLYHVSSTMMVNGTGRTDHGHIYKVRPASICQKLNEAWHRNPNQNWYGFALPGPFGWCSLEHYRTRVVKMVRKVNMMSKQEYLEASNTPGYLSPSSERYWSM